MSESEFPRPIRIDALSDTPRRIEISADEQERAALARRFGLIAIARIDAEADARRVGEVVSVAGRLHAAVTQACVASGEPVAATLDEPFALRFEPERASADEEVELAEEDLDKLAYAGNAIDLGEAVAQTLALALDPFPRAPSADSALREAGVLDEGALGPFAALKALKDRLT